MAQRPAELTPLVSAQHFFGAELRHWRQHRGLSIADLARSVFASPDLIGKVEKARRWPRQELVDRCEAVLDSGGLLRRLYALALAERSPETGDPRSRGDDVTRLAVLVVAPGEATDQGILDLLRRMGHAPTVFAHKPIDAPDGTVINIGQARTRRQINDAAAARYSS